jgi:hypothetical protein
MPDFGLLVFRDSYRPFKDRIIALGFAKTTLIASSFPFHPRRDIIKPTTRCAFQEHC